MKLTFEQIKGITVGALRIWEEENGYCFARCTEKQLAAFTEANPVWGERAAATTGIRLDFVTDATAIRFRLSGGTRCELFLNGVLRKQYKMDEEKEPVTFEFDDGIGGKLPEYHVTVYFPNHTTGVLDKDFELINATYCRRVSFDRKILFYGDSITQGWDTGYDSITYTNCISRFFNAESVNMGVGGAVFLKSTFDGDIDFDPDIVSVAYGTNDFSHGASFEEMKRNTVEFLDEVKKKYSDKKVFIITPIWRLDREGRQVGDFGNALKMIAEESNARGFITVNGLNLVPPLSDFFADIRLHPNTCGFLLYAENLAAFMAKYIF